MTKTVYYIEGTHPRMRNPFRCPVKLDSLAEAQATLAVIKMAANPSLNYRIVQEEERQDAK